MQVERADKASEKAENRLETLEIQVTECLSAKVEAEKVAAVAVQRSTDLAEQLKDTKANLAEIKNETKAFYAQFTKDINDLRDSNKGLEIKNAALIEAAKQKKLL